MAKTGFADRILIRPWVLIGAFKPRKKEDGAESLYLLYAAPGRFMASKRLEYI